MRNVRRARPVLDSAIDTALAELPPELRPAMIAYVDAMRAEYEARSALSAAMTGHGVRWLGHLTVSCQEPGCQSRWFRPRHDSATASDFRYPARS